MHMSEFSIQPIDVSRIQENSWGNSPKILNIAVSYFTKNYKSYYNKVYSNELVLVNRFNALQDLDQDPDNHLASDETIPGQML